VLKVETADLGKVVGWKEEPGVELEFWLCTGNDWYKDVVRGTVDQSAKFHRISWWGWRSSHPPDTVGTAQWRSRPVIT